MSLRLLVLTSLVLGCSTLSVSNSTNVGGVLDAIEKSLHKVLDLKGLTPAQLQSAKKVADSVEKSVAELESPKGKLLSKEVRAAKVMGAMKELQDLQGMWQQAAPQGIDQKKADLMRQLSEKKAALEKDEQMLKVVKLEKELAERKQQLQKLMSMKAAQEHGGEAQQVMQKEVDAQQETVAKMKTISGDKPAMLKSVVAYLEDRKRNLTASIAKIDTDEKKHEDDSLAKAPVTGKDDAIARGAALIKAIMKKEHREVEKTRVVLKSELKEITEAEKAVKKGDIKSLKEIMTHMQGDMKAMAAKSNKFLY